MMNVGELIEEIYGLFQQRKYDEAIPKLEQALDAIDDKNEQIYEPHKIYFLLGDCYFEQAKKTQDTSEMHELFKQAAEHFKQQLELAKQLADKQNSIQEQNNAQLLLGCCYFEQAQKTQDTSEMHELFKQAAEHFKQQLELAKQLTNEQFSIQKQNLAQNWLGLCYFLQARTTDNLSDADNLFKRAVGYLKESIKLSEQLTDKKISIKEQNNAQYCLFRCYVVYAIKINTLIKNKSYKHITIDRNPQKEDLLNHAEKLYHQIKNNIAALSDDEKKQFQGIHHHLSIIYFLRAQPEEYYTEKNRKYFQKTFQH